MKKRKSKGLRIAVISSAAVAAAALLVSAANPDFVLGKNLQLLFNTFRELNLLYVDPVDPDQMLKDAAQGMVARLDPYTELFTESEVSQLELETTGKYAGIGALVRRKGDYVEISQPYRGFPADKAGLVIGDRILAVDGKDMKGAEVEEVSDRLKGDPGTAVRLKIEKMLTGDTVDLTVRRERIAIPAIAYYGKVADSIGYIVHDRFTEDCSEEVRKAFMALRREGINALIIDLRNNGGGILQEAVEIMSMFVPKGTEIVSMRGRMAELDAVFHTQHEPIDTQIAVAVMVNGYSASSAEIEAGAFQDLDRGVLVGQRTFGKGLVQTPRPLGYNAVLKVTTAKYYIPSGRCIQAIDYAHRDEQGRIGLVPDSLIREFRTANGRRVYDGGGVMPDLKTDTAGYLSGFSVALYAKGYIEDFANEYYKRHRTPVEIGTFRLTDADYADFTAFMADKEIGFESETQQALAQMREKAEREKYLDRISDDLDAISDKIRENRTDDLARFREEISRLIEDEIVLRYHYSQGVIQHKIGQDKELRQAVALLSDRARYREILSSQDTSRK